MALEKLYSIKELSQKFNVSEKSIYEELRKTKELNESIIYKSKKTYLDESGLQILTEIMCKEIESEEQVVEDEPKIEQIEMVTDSSENNSETLHINGGHSLDKKNPDESISLLTAQIKEKDNQIKKLMSIIENSQSLMEKDREQLLQETMYYKTLEMLEERASKFDENIPYLRSKLDAKKNSKKWWKKN
ncbi:hypothetical protein [Candidatus Arthromitus sp. SFB-rat-Yit]|uniref:hypothetical protein n=1 Tax=Candidatus Arthromitus sp. SFB-rat-Yit TaxID=1041504 RepID=UPI000227A175|nr:hypothetical protein [Candidatus Arthromitus sp. SFB-rat-Yit]BAK81299.1 hypothetical protein RATSFB_0737 [Candidatus Arthromitus sp. SFB-rat-Yit]